MHGPGMGNVLVAEAKLWTLRHVRSDPGEPWGDGEMLGWLVLVIMVGDSWVGFFSTVFFSKMAFGPVSRLSSLTCQSEAAMGSTI